MDARKKNKSSSYRKNVSENGIKSGKMPVKKGNMALSLSTLAK